MSVAVHLEQIRAHLERHVGKVEWVFHDPLPAPVHVDLLHVPPCDGHPYQLLVTSGMSDEPMEVPGPGFQTRAEMMIALPPGWPLTGPGASEERHYWPAGWLKFVASLPRAEETYIGLGTTIPNGDPARPIANTGFTGVIATVPFWMPEEFFEMWTEAGETVAFFLMIPIYPEEMDLVLRLGPPEIGRRLDTIGLKPALDPARPNAAISDRPFAG